MPAGLQIVRKTRTWFYFEIIHFLSYTSFFFPVSDLWLERAGVLGPCVTPWVFVAPEISDKTQSLHSQWGGRGVSAETGRGTEGTQGLSPYQPFPGVTSLGV